MAITELMAIPQMGMQYHKMQVDAASLNIAQSNVVQPADGSGFKALTVIPTEPEVFGNNVMTPTEGKLQRSSAADKLVYKPGHPGADNYGYVHYANVNIAEQMVTITEATRAYEANVKAFNAQMNMALKAMEIGK